MLAVILTTALPSAAAHARGGRERLDRVERHLIRLVNRERARHGLAWTRPVRSLSRAADFHSWEMLHRNFFAHASANGRSTAARVSRYRRARTTGETLAYIPRGPRRTQARQVLVMWMNSPGHRAVLLNPAFTRIGVARRSGRFAGRDVTVFTADLQSGR